MVHLPLSRQYGAVWARAVTLHWLWRPQHAHLEAALDRVDAWRHGARLLRGEHVALVMPACPTEAPTEVYPHASDDPCAEGDEWRDGRLDAAPYNGCFPTEAAARCAFSVRASLRLHTHIDAPTPAVT